jgi:hypothetical protein
LKKLGGKADGPFSEGVNDAGLPESFALPETGRQAQGNDPCPMRGIAGRERLDASPVRPLDDPIRQPLRVGNDAVQTELEEQLQCRVQPRELLEWQRDELEAAHYGERGAPLLVSGYARN